MARNTFVEALVNEAVKALKIAMDQGRYIPKFHFVEHCYWDNYDYEKEYNLFKLGLGLGKDVFIAGNENFTRFCLVTKNENGSWETDVIFSAYNLPLDWCERILDSILRMDLDREAS
jgi:hypothetical protein